jgi:hypothetical protein
MEMKPFYDNRQKKILTNYSTIGLKKTNNQRYKHGQRFYPRTINLTKIKFTKEEQTLLNYGLQHRRGKPLKTYWMNLIIEIERVIKLLDVNIQNAFRIMATKKLKQIYNSNNINSLHKPQLYILNNLKQKIVIENAMIAKTDKGKTTVIIYKDEYAEKIHTFLTEN